MKEPYRILMPYFTRSELGPLAPLMNVMKRDERLEAITVPKKMDSLQAIDDILTVLSPDMVMCAFDRPEMPPVAYGAYHRHFPITQIFAGDIAGGAVDDRDRFVISTYADLLFCADAMQKQLVEGALAWRILTEDMPKIVVSGATHFDDMEYEEASFKGHKLVLYNPPSLATDEQMLAEVKQIASVIGEDDEVVWIESNGDRGSDAIREYARIRNTHFLPSMPRPKFLGLLKYSKEFIGNSSSMYYEAPYFGIRTVQIGMRNKYRQPISKEMCKPGASKIICEEIVKYLDVKRDG